MEKFIVSIKAKQRYSLGDPVNITFSITNNTDSEQKVLKWNTPFDKFSQGYLYITNQGKFLEYDGVFMKRGEPLADDYIVIPPRETKSTTLDLTTIYNLNEPGLYDLQFSGFIDDFFEKKKNIKSSRRFRRLFQAEPLESNKISFEIIDTTVKRSKKIRMTVGAKQRDIEKNYDKLKKDSKGSSYTFLQPDIILRQNPKNKFDSGELFIEMTIDAHYALGEFIPYSYADLSLSPDTEPGHVEMIFGKYCYDNFKGFYSVRDNLITMRDVLRNTKFTYSFNGDRCKDNSYAYTFKGSKTVYLCNMYKKAPFSGENSKMGTLFHELTHAIIGTNCDENGKPTPEVYGREECRKLAIKDPAKACKNADSYEFFLETVFTYWKDKGIFDINPDYQTLIKERTIIPYYNPNLTVYQGSIFTVYQNPKSGDLCCTTYNGKVSSTTIINSSKNIYWGQPGVVVYKNKLFVTYKKGGNLEFITYDGKNWSSNQILIMNFDSDYDPGVAVYKDKIFIVYYNFNYDICCATYDGTIAATHTIAKLNRTTKYGDTPGIGICDDTLFVIYNDLMSNLYAITYDGTSWSKPNYLHEHCELYSQPLLGFFPPISSQSPRLSSINDFLYISCENIQTKTSHQLRMYRDSNTKKFILTDNEELEKSSDEPNKIKTSQPYSVVKLKDCNYAIHYGNREQHPVPDGSYPFLYLFRQNNTIHCNDGSW